MLVSCITSEMYIPDVCSSSKIGTMPMPMTSGIKFGPITFNHKIDYSDTFSKVKDFNNNISVSNIRFLIIGSASLATISSINVSLVGDTDDLPLLLIGRYDGIKSLDNKLNIVLVVDNETVYRYLSHPVTMVFTASGVTPIQSIILSNSICLDIDGSFNKKL